MSKHVRITGAGGPEVLSIVDGEPAEVAPEEVRIEVAAAGLNRADCLQRRGFYPAPKGVVQDVPGLEFAGIVTEVGKRAERWSIGDRVMGICAGGAMSTEIVSQHSTLVPVPKGMSLTDAAAIPEVFMTAYDALEQAGMQAGHTVLIHAIGSGVGSAALQLVKRWGGSAIGTSRSSEKLERAKALGLEKPVLVSEKRFAAECKSLNEGHGVHAILDFIGAAYLAENLKSLKSQGSLVVIGLLGGVAAELPLGLLLAKRARIVGTVLRSRNLAEKAVLAQAFERDVLPGFGDGTLVPVVDRVMPMTDIADAHRYLESNASFGKVVMAW